MSDDILKKLASTFAAADKIKNITDLAGKFAPQSAVDMAIQRSLAVMAPSNTMLDAMTKSALALNSHFFEPEKFNPMMGSMSRVMQMMNQINHVPYNPIGTSVLDKMRDFAAPYNAAISPLLGLTQLTSRLLSDVKFDTFNWRETYPDMFTKEPEIENSSEYSKFNENLDKLIDMSIFDKDSTLTDAVAVSVNLDNHADGAVLNPVREEIFSIANQAIEALTQGESFEERFNFYLTRLWKIANSPLTVAIVSAIIGAIFAVHYANYVNKDSETEKKVVELEKKLNELEMKTPTNETVLTAKEIPVKVRADKKSKTIDILPIGVEIEVIKPNPKWTKIIYTKNFVPQIGYCRTEELKIFE